MACFSRFSNFSSPPVTPDASEEQLDSQSATSVTERDLQPGPVSIEEYRARTRRVCTECGHGLSIIANRDICGRCAARPYQPDTTAARSNQDAIDQLRGEVLAAEILGEGYWNGPHASSRKPSVIAR